MAINKDLKDIVSFAISNSPFYQEHFKGHEVPNTFDAFINYHLPQKKI